MLEKVKKALRISNNALNDEIEMLIESCLIDLKTSGCDTTETNSLIQLAIITYVKANFGLDNKDSYKYLKSYESIKIKLAILGAGVNVL